MRGWNGKVNHRMIAAEDRPDLRRWEGESTESYSARLIADLDGCICPLVCDCDSPDTNPARVSNLCPEHNLTPLRDDECPYAVPGGIHRNGARNKG